MAVLLAGPLQAVLSVSRRDRGPVAVPISYHFADGVFYMITSPDSLHGRLMSRDGRATVTVQFDECDGRTVHQWYVHAEGPVRFTELDPKPHVEIMLVKDRGEARMHEWRAANPSADMRVAVLEPEQISGYEFRESLDS